MTALSVRLPLPLLGLALMLPPAAFTQVKYVPLPTKDEMRSLQLLAYSCSAGERPQQLRSDPEHGGSTDGSPAAASRLQGHALGIDPGLSGGQRQQLSTAGQH